MTTLSETAADPYGEPRGRLAAQLAARIQRRWRAEVLAIGVRGSLAHEDDRDGTDVELIVVTYRPGTGPIPALQRIDGHIVDLAVSAQHDLLAQARTLTVRWPLLADRYLHVRPLYDEVGWLAGLRDAHLARLAEATSREFNGLARQAWCGSWSLFQRAIRSGQWHDEDGALLLVAEARTAAAVTEGLLGRTYFRSTADAIRRAAVADLDLVELRARLDQHAAELAKRGGPVDGTIEDLLK